MRFVFFGLTISSSWGNGHATLLRGLFKALVRRGHSVVFFERDVPYYASHRDLTGMPGVELILYSNWMDMAKQARVEVDAADVAMVTSYCPDGLAASELVCSSNVVLRMFYDLDTPVTLDCLRSGTMPGYVSDRGFRDFDMVLSYTGGAALDELQSVLGARTAVPLYGSVDAEVHRPACTIKLIRSDLSYLGTYAEDRQPVLEELFLKPARNSPFRRFLIGGSKYPQDFPWTENTFYVQHVQPSSHSQFYCSSRITLNVTRRAMAQMGFCPSGRLFEAAACGVPILSDYWEGLECFFEPGAEILPARNSEDTLHAMELTDAELNRISRAARERTLEQHSANRRAEELETICGNALHPESEFECPVAPTFPFGTGAEV
jgi:spore maturation protein CgeB